MTQPPAGEHARDAIVVGLMSGTSLDGIAAAAVRITARHGARAEAALLSFVHRPFTTDQRARLERAMIGGTAQEYCRLDVDMGGWLADAALLALAETDVPRADVTCIASHGQTLWHEAGHSTWQVGDPATIAERTGCPVVADFRARDVAAGGQGAPLVPMADAMLFAHDSQWRALQNIGGIANVSIVPPAASGDRQLDGVRAFDTGPGVVLIDAVTRTLRPELPYDIDGRMAQQGTPVKPVVDEALAHPYFRGAPPKSTGRELFTPGHAAHFIDDCRRHGATEEDIVASAVSLTARSIAEAYARFVPEPITECLLSGGGARNPALVDAIRDAFAAQAQAAAQDGGGQHPAPVVLDFADCYFDGDAKEAVAFAFLGYLTHAGRAGNVPRATGARGPRRLGVMVPA